MLAMHRKPQGELSPDYAQKRAQFGAFRKPNPLGGSFMLPIGTTKVEKWIQLPYHQGQNMLSCSHER